MTRDALETLSALRPSAPLAQTWQGEDPAQARDRILATGHADLDAASPARRRRRRRATVLAAGLAVGVTVAGGAAAATGLVPAAFSQVYGEGLAEQPLVGNHGIDPADTERVKTVTGPDSHLNKYSVMKAKGKNGYVCIMPVFETQQSAKLPIPAEFTGQDWICQTPTDNNPYSSAFGDELSVGYDRATDANAYLVAAGGAVRATLKTATGRTYPVVLAEGWFGGWFPSSADDQPESLPVLTGYAADGRVVGTSPIQGWKSEPS